MQGPATCPLVCEKENGWHQNVSKSHIIFDGPPKNVSARDNFYAEKGHQFALKMRNFGEKNHSEPFKQNYFDAKCQLLTSFHESFSGITKKRELNVGKIGTFRTMFVMADNTAN